MKGGHMLSDLPEETIKLLRAHAQAFAKIEPPPEHPCDCDQRRTVYRAHKEPCDEEGDHAV